MSASSGRGVFDGNVKVQRLAQQTDAAQLSRNLLLAPRGMPIPLKYPYCTTSRSFCIKACSSMNRVFEIWMPRAATVNVKPNLQIIADDVKCSHGCAVSDLEEDQLFYFR